MMHVLLMDSGFRVHKPHCANGTTTYYHLTKQQAAVVERLTSRLVRVEVRNGDGPPKEAETVERLARVLARLP